MPGEGAGVLEEGVGVLGEGAGVWEGAGESLGVEHRFVHLSWSGPGSASGWRVPRSRAPGGDPAQGPYLGRPGMRAGCGSWEAVAVDWGHSWWSLLPPEEPLVLPEPGWMRS